jgi:hypothetical protein
MRHELGLPCLFSSSVNCSYEVSQKSPLWSPSEFGSVIHSIQSDLDDRRMV